MAPRNSNNYEHVSFVFSFCRVRSAHNRMVMIGMNRHGVRGTTEARKKSGVIDDE